MAINPSSKLLLSEYFVTAAGKVGRTLLSYKTQMNFRNALSSEGIQMQECLLVTPFTCILEVAKPVSSHRKQVGGCLELRMGDIECLGKLWEVNFPLLMVAEDMGCVCADLLKIV